MGLRDSGKQPVKADAMMDVVLHALTMARCSIEDLDGPAADTVRECLKSLTFTAFHAKLAIKLMIQDKALADSVTGKLLDGEEMREKARKDAELNARIDALRDELRAMGIEAEESDRMGMEDDGKDMRTLRTRARGQGAILLHGELRPVRPRPQDVQAVQDLPDPRVQAGRRRHSAGAHDGRQGGRAMAVVARIARTPKAWSITVSVDSANTIVFDAVKLSIDWTTAKNHILATAADGSQMVVTPDVLLCSEPIETHMDIEKENER